MAIATINPATGEIVNTFQAEALFDPDRDSNYASAELTAILERWAAGSSPAGPGYASTVLSPSPSMRW